MIRFNCSNCHVLVKAPEGKEGKWSVCPRCGHSLQVPRLATAYELPPVRYGGKVVELTDRTISHQGIFLSFLAWCCPLSLLFALLMDTVYVHLYWHRSIYDIASGKMSGGLTLLGAAAIVSMLTGFLLTVTVFIWGCLRNSRLPIVLSSVIFVLSFLLIPLVFWLR